VFLELRLGIRRCLASKRSSGSASVGSSASRSASAVVAYIPSLFFETIIHVLHYSIRRPDKRYKPRSDAARSNNLANVDVASSLSKLSASRFGSTLARMAEVCSPVSLQ
jgi:hypothetical protein